MAEPFDIESASHLIGLVYDDALAHDPWLALLEHLSIACPGHVASLARFREDDWKTDDVDDLYHAIDLRAEVQPGTVVSTRRLFDDATFRGFRTYLHRMAHSGAGHWVGLHFAVTPAARDVLMLIENDWSSVRKVPDKAEALLTLIAPHMVRAQTMADALSKRCGSDCA